jgi:hypothetical protein
MVSRAESFDFELERQTISTVMLSRAFYVNPLFPITIL